MTQTSWPFENIDTTEDQFSRWARHIGEGVNGGPDDTKLKVTGDDSGLQVRIASGEAMVRGHYYLNSAQETLAITSAGLNTRIDAIVLELDNTLNRIILKVVEGSAVPSNPTAPSIIQTDSGVYQLLLGHVLVRSGVSSILSSDVTDRRTFLSAQSSLSPFLLMGA